MLRRRHPTGAGHGSAEKVGPWTLEVTASRSIMSMLGGTGRGCVKEAEAPVTDKLQVAS